MSTRVSSRSARPARLTLRANRPNLPARRNRVSTMTDDVRGSGSITHWIGELARGDADEAARHLWDRYFDRLVGLARSRLRAVQRGAADEEDAALSAFDSLCRGVTAGRFPRLDGREDLWRLLAT